MKLSLRQNIPLEVWADINDLLQAPAIRRKLAELVNQSGDTEFTKIFMKLLHELGNITLGELSFHESDKDNTATLLTPWSGVTPIAQTQMPDNIKSFEHIRIIHFDAQVLDFCRKLRTLFTGVRLSIAVWSQHSYAPQNPWNDIAVILNHLAPLIIGDIRSLWIDAERAVGNFLGWAINEPAFQAAFARTNILTLMRFPLINWANETMVNFLPQWLTTDRAEGEPKMAYICLMPLSEEFRRAYKIMNMAIEEVSYDQAYAAIIMAIKENFLAAKVPSTFFVRLGTAIEFREENKLTGEQLTVKDGQIWRHKIGDEAKAELGAWIDANKNISSPRVEPYGRLISLDYHPTIGSFDEPQDENVDVAIADGEKVKGREDGGEGKA